MKVNDKIFGYGIRQDGKILYGARAKLWLDRNIQTSDDDNFTDVTLNSSQAPLAIAYSDDDVTTANKCAVRAVESEETTPTPEPETDADAFDDNFDSCRYTGTSQGSFSGGVRQLLLLTSGNLTCEKDLQVDVFVVGGGGGGGKEHPSGGGGGYTNTCSKMVITKNQSYHITIGAGGASGVAGESTSALSCSATGGTSNTFTSQGGYGANGGSGGGAKRSDYSHTGGTDGANGNDSEKGGKGQGFTTCPFKELGCMTPFSRGGNAGNTTIPAENTGNGGDGWGKGGSGVVILRIAAGSSGVKNSSPFASCQYNGDFQESIGKDGKRQLSLLTSGNLTCSNRIEPVSVFVVGGGGGGGTNHGAGGGGGYTNTCSDTSISKGQSYQITIGAGGTSGVAGESTSALGCSATGGTSNPTTSTGQKGADGGSGGGGKYSDSFHRGGTDGGNGSNAERGGRGQGFTTCPFRESGCETPYSKGGNAQFNESQAPNTGNGGGGYTGVGGSGIVIIRYEGS